MNKFTGKVYSRLDRAEWPLYVAMAASFVVALYFTR